MINRSSIRLGVNIDHVATLRQARGTRYPDPIQAALQAYKAGADLITLHLREDRRHIQDHDVKSLKQHLSIPINLEMAITEEMICFATEIKPAFVCLVPEKRQELTTEGGLNVAAAILDVKVACERLAKAGIKVSLFIDPAKSQVDAALECGAPIIELHTGHYADAQCREERLQQLARITSVAEYADHQGLIVNAGHGLHYDNVHAIAEIPVIHELNIGHSIIARSVFIGLDQAVREMKALMIKVREPSAAPVL